jgi:hypothetical protein
MRVGALMSIESIRQVIPGHGKRIVIASRWLNPATARGIVTVVTDAGVRIPKEFRTGVVARRGAE